MKCSDFLQELTNYLDGVLDARTKAELEDHLAWCHNCYVVCDTTKKTIEIYRDSQLYELCSAFFCLHLLMMAVRRRVRRSSGSSYSCESR